MGPIRNTVVFYLCAQKKGKMSEGVLNHWTMLMENLIRSKGYWTLIESGILEQIKIAFERKLKDLKVKNHLFQAIDRNEDSSQQGYCKREEVVESITIKFLNCWLL